MDNPDKIATLGTQERERRKTKVCINISTTGATGGAGTAYPSGAPEFIHGF
jgi:hypothetical protein